jgi:hypothetical protein
MRVFRPLNRPGKQSGLFGSFALSPRTSAYHSHNALSPSPDYALVRAHLLLPGLAHRTYHTAGNLPAHRSAQEVCRLSTVPRTGFTSTVGIHSTPWPPRTMALSSPQIPRRAPQFSDPRRRRLASRLREAR